jgi:hypothetical protein
VLKWHVDPFVGFVLVAHFRLEIMSASASNLLSHLSAMWAAS